MVVVSPWAAAAVAPLAGAGAHYEHASLAATLRQAFPANFPAPLNARDAAAAPLTALWEGTPFSAPRADTPMTLPPVPAGPSPSLEGRSRRGEGAMNHLQHSLLLLAEAAALEAEGGAGAVAAAGGVQGILQALAARGAMDSEAAAGLHARARMGAFAQRRP